MKMKNVFQTEYSNSVDTILSKDRTVSDNERALYMHLVDHPHFIAGVEKIRTQLGIHDGGCVDGQQAFDWEHANKSNKNALRSATEKLVSDFSIKPLFVHEAELFTYSYALSPKTIWYLLPLEGWSKSEQQEIVREVGRHKTGARVIQTNKDLEFNKHLFKADTVYLEIAPHTVLRDLQAAWKKIAKRKKDLRPLAISKTQTIARRAWRLAMQGKKDPNIARQINDEFGTTFVYSDIGVYRHRYKKALDKLKPIAE
jgi:hypothetical protein